MSDASVTWKRGQFFGDPVTAPFWAAAQRHELVMQVCACCRHYQFYPRPFCLKCGSCDLIWAPVSGMGTIYSMTVTRVPIGPTFQPPYVVAVVELDEGPRLLTNIVNGESAIGGRVRVVWRDRIDGPPLPLFEPDATI